MSGHSKWSTIKHKKAKVDSQRAVVFQKYSRELIVSARLGGPDPAGNFRLRTAIEKAKAAGLPNDNIKRAIEKGAGSGAGATGCVGWMFDQRGVIRFDDSVDFEKLFETAISLDALDITEEDGEYKVITTVENFQNVVEGLEKAGFKSVTAEFTRIPQNTIEVTDENTASQILKLLDKLEEHDDVQNVYANFDISDEILQKLEG